MTLEHKRFPKEEYETRWLKAQEKMTASQLDALLITEANNYTYFSGGHGDFSFSRPTIMILPKNGYPAALVHDFFVPSQRRESYIEHLFSYPTFDNFPCSRLKEVFEKLGLLSGKIGAELGKEQRLGISFFDFSSISEAFPHIEFIDASDLLWALRMIKSKNEVDCMRRACRITGQAFEKCFASVKPGMTEASAVQALLGATGAGGGAQAWVVSNSGPDNYESGFLTKASNRALEPGNMLWLDSGCKYNGYASDFSRMAVIEKASSEQRSMFEIVNDITMNVVDAVRPGLPIASLSKLCNELFERAGLKDLWGPGDCSTAQTNRAQRIGHGIGMATTEPPHIALFEDTLLKPGMTITIEPTIALDFGHLNIESNVLVTEDGYEVLSKAPRELIVI